MATHSTPGRKSPTSPASGRKPGQRTRATGKGGQPGAPQRKSRPTGAAHGSGNARTPTSRRIRPFRFLTRLLTRFLILAVIWVSIAVVGVLAYEATQLPDISNLIRVTRSDGIRLLASDGSEFASFGSVHGRPIEIADMPPTLINALVATEDRRFFQHFGIDPIAVLRAVYVNLRDGGIRQGASTLTQQLAKNLFLTADRSLERKLQELLLSFWLEASFTKEQILTIYFNRVYFGAGTYGIDAAARKFFGKPPEQLGLYESALLVGLLKAPSRYNPAANPQLAAERTRVVLRSMVESGLLAQDRAEAALANPPPTRLTAVISRGYRYFADWVLDRSAGYAGGAGGDQTIITTLDRTLQDLAETAVRDGLAADATADAAEISMVVMTADGSVRAMIGGRDYARSKFNRATQARRQPGSAFKPFVYLAALAAGYQPDSMIDDTPVTLAGWSPRNFDGRFHGPVTLRRALALSLNAATVRLSEAVGRRRIVALVRQLGLTAKMNEGPSLALGVNEVTPLELTAAYAALANGGHPVEPHGITAVSSTGGRDIYRHQAARQARVVPPVALAGLTEMLREVIRAGTGRQAAIGRPAAGKTGTSQNHRDAWFVGYTDDLVAGVWIGRDDSRPMDRLTGGQTPARIWARFMRAAAVHAASQ